MGTPGQRAPANELIDVDALKGRYAQTGGKLAPVSFGTSGHRGTALSDSFQDAHIAAITQAICEFRTEFGATGPLVVGKDTHALSAPAETTVIEVLTGNGVEFLWGGAGAIWATPVVSRALVRENAKRDRKLDAIILTPSHNPPEDGGIKYNPPHGGPAGSSITSKIQKRANEILEAGGTAVRRKSGAPPLAATVDLVAPYVEELALAVDLAAISKSGIRFGVDPMGGAAVPVWERLDDERFPLSLVNRTVDPTFSFLPCDNDGRIRMDCSSAAAMADLVLLRDRFDVAAGTDTDADRHGIVARDGLLNPNYFLSMAADYLLETRKAWPKELGIGKTIVTSLLVDRVAARYGRKVYEVPVGFKWFVEPLLDGSIGFCGEESAGATLLDRHGAVWTTDKDGIVMALLAAEMRAVRERDLSDQAAALFEQFGQPTFKRRDSALDDGVKAKLKSLEAAPPKIDKLGELTVKSVSTKAPSNGESIGGVKVVTDRGWFAARPSGTEPIVKVYAESFDGDSGIEALFGAASEVLGR